MTQRPFDEALARSLEALADGVSIADCLARYPEHARELRAHLILLAPLRQLQLPVPPAAREAGLRKLREALQESAVPQTPLVRPSRAALVPRAVLVGLMGAALLLGSVAASPAVGGPDVVDVFLTTVGVRDERAREQGAGGASGPEGPRGTEVALTEEQAVGLCQAHGGGSDQGRSSRVDATAFRRLEAAAVAANQSVDAYCEAVAASKDGTPAGQRGPVAVPKADGRGRPTAAPAGNNSPATATPARDNRPTPPPAPGKGR